MKWDYFYEHYADWSESTLANRIYSLENFGSSNELIEVVEETNDEKVAGRLIRKALAAGMLFTKNQIFDLVDSIDSKTMGLVITKANENGCAFTYEDMIDLDGSVDHDVLVEIDRCQGIHAFDDENDPIEIPERKWRPGCLFGLFVPFGRHVTNQREEAAPYFQIGDRVRVKYRGQEGTIVDINGSLFMVSLDDGRHVDSYTESQLEKTWW